LPPVELGQRDDAIEVVDLDHAGVGLVVTSGGRVADVDSSPVVAVSSRATAVKQLLAISFASPVIGLTLEARTLPGATVGALVAEVN
jgi:hypothetical protein